MSWRFRKSFSPIPGLRVTISPRGLTTSVGIGPFRLSSGPGGAALSATIPGTGLSYRQPLSSPGSPGAAGSPHTPTDPQRLSPLNAPPQTALPGMTEIKSGGSHMMTSEGLEVFKETLTKARLQHSDILEELTEAKGAEARDVKRYKDWAGGYVLRRLMKQRFEAITLKAKDARARRKELQMQLELSRVNTQFEMPDKVAHAFARLSDDFGACAESQRVWDNVAHRATNKNAERTAASRVVDLKPVKFQLGRCEVVDAPMLIPCLQNANGGDLYLYPGFLLYLASPTNYALIEVAELGLKVEPTRFFEEGPLPADAKRVGTTWAKTNLDGTRDKRFKENYEIAVMQYAKLTLTSTSGLNEEYMLSNLDAAEAFGRAWTTLQNAVRHCDN